MSKFCFVVPCYQHGKTLQRVLEDLVQHQHKIFVVNDGSDPINSMQIATACNLFLGVTLLSHVKNQGKGSALTTGFRQALGEGYTHAIQVDADGQHDLKKISGMKRISERFPNDLVSGRPIYDASVPRSRLIGRYVTHVWVWIETLSLQIQDSMCGFRIYPLVATLQVIEKYKVGHHMQFDTEVMVRLYWLGLRVHQLPVAVIYPVDGISNFDVLQDNIRISKMHTRLFFAMWLRFPQLLWRSLVTNQIQKPWHRIEELGGLFGLRILLFVYRLLGRNFLRMFLYPIALYYNFFNRTSKEASLRYRQLLKEYTGAKASPFSTFQHIRSFAEMALDKFAVWFGDVKMQDLQKDDLRELLAISGQIGAFFISSHYGNIEICRALGRQTTVKFTALVYHENAKKFNENLSKINPDSTLDMISVKNVGPEMAIHLKDKVDRGEWVFMMGDRLSIQDKQKVQTLTILGKPAEVSKGPFVLAYLLDVPVYAIHCYRQDKQFRIKVNRLDEDLERGKNLRDEFVNCLALRYSQELESLILNDPRQWYNFFQFWRAS